MTGRRDNNLRDNIAPAGPATGPLLLWLLIQLAALLIAAMRVPLAAKYPQPAELLAAHVMLVAQVAGSALLFPFLMNGAATAVVVIASAWPFLAIAAVLSATPARGWAAAAGYVTLWLVGLALWRVVLRGAASQGYAIAIASLVTVGGAALAHLGLEFNPSSAPVGASGTSFLSFTPLIAALRQLSPDAPVSASSLPAASCTAAMLAIIIARRPCRNRLSTVPAPGG